MHFQLFLPDAMRPVTDAAQTSFADWMTACGVDHLSTGPIVHMPGKGPDGTGILVGWLSTKTGNTKLEYLPQSQTWIKSLCGRYWVGFHDDSPPTESQLRHDATQPGEWHQLGQSKWKLTTASTIPHEAKYNSDGGMFWTALPEFSWIADETKKLQDDLLEQQSPRLLVVNVDPSCFVEWLLTLLKINYRITPEVAVHLGLWRSDQLTDVVLQTLGLSRSEAESDG